MNTTTSTTSFNVKPPHVPPISTVRTCAWKRIKAGWKTECGRIFPTKINPLDFQFSFCPACGLPILVED